MRERTSGKWQAPKWPGANSRTGGISSAHRLLHLRASRAEHASRGRVDRAGQVALQQDALPRPLGSRVGQWHGGGQSVGVRMQRRTVDLLRVGDLHDPAEVHHSDPVGDVAHDGQVVRDEDVGQPELVLQVLEQVDDLGLDRHVERRDRLVADDQLRAQRDGPGDTDALALAAGELVRIAVEVFRVQPDSGHQVLHLGLDTPGRLDPLHLEGSRDDRADGVPGVQRGVGVLEDHLHLAAERHHLLAREIRDVAPVELDAPAGGVQELENGTAGSRLAAA